MTIENILTNNAENITNDLASKIKYKAKVASIDSQISDFFNGCKRQILYKLTDLSQGRLCCGSQISREELTDKDIMKDAILFIKKQAYDNLNNYDDLINTIVIDDDSNNGEKEEKVECPCKKDDSEETIEIPVALTTPQVASTNFGY